MVYLFIFLLREAVWNLLREEHFISKDGVVGEESKVDHSIDTFFNESLSGGNIQNFFFR